MKQIGCLNTSFGESLTLIDSGELLDPDGFCVGRLKRDKKILRFEIDHPRRMPPWFTAGLDNKIAGVIRGADVVVPNYRSANVPATIKIGELLDQHGQPLTAAILMSLLHLDLHDVSYA